MELKLWLSFLLLQGKCQVKNISQKLLKVTSNYRSVFFFALVSHCVQSPGGKWTANVPAVIPALQGSCVVIPCTYNYPKPKSKKILNRWKGFWKKGNKIMSTNLRKWKLPKEYKRRTKFLGNLKWHNCTMMLDGIRKTDVGPFYFRIEMPQYKSFSYINNTVSLLVMSEYCCNFKPLYSVLFTH